MGGLLGTTGMCLQVQITPRDRKACFVGGKLREKRSRTVDYSHS